MTSDFPSLDPTAIRVAWAPLILEPLAADAERVVVAIVGVTDSGEVRCWRRVDRRRMRTLFEDMSEHLGAVVDASITSLHGHLSQSRTLEGWNSPFVGVYLGSGSTCYVSAFDDALHTAAMQCSILGGPPDGAARPKSAAPADAWCRSVDDWIKSMQPALANSVNAQVRLTRKQLTVTFKFYGVRLAANVVVLDPKRLAPSLREAKAHLWNLSSIKYAPDLLFKPDRLELLAGIKDVDSRGAANDVVDELAHEAECRDVAVVPVESSEAAAERIVLRAA